LIFFFKSLKACVTEKKFMQALVLVQCCFQAADIALCLWCCGCCEYDNQNRRQNLDEEEKKRQQQQQQHGLSKEELSMTPDELYYYHKRQEQQQQQRQHQMPNPFLEVR
jgi:hypothetical protein